MKKYINKLLLLLPLLLLLTPLFGQTYSTGAILDPEIYAQIDTKPVLTTRSYINIPQAVSLRQYSPIPGDQGIYGTCTGWAVAYSVRTVSESVALNRTNQLQNQIYISRRNYISISNDKQVSGLCLCIFFRQQRISCR